MTPIFARRALLAEGWRSNVRVTAAHGTIIAVAANSAAQAGDTSVDALLPAVSNLHSHTFQRAMAGMAEVRGGNTDSFWTWRELMYRFLEHLTPEDIEAIAAQAFVEMQTQGFAAVAEFHYVHHQQGGATYDNLSEMSQRIMAAASVTGIGLTHLPVLYSRGGMRGENLTGGQLRFGNATERFLKLQQEAASALTRLLPTDCRIGVAPHSLRAVDLKQLQHIASAMPELPKHIHIAEQQREVDDVRAVQGLRPVQWLFDNINIDKSWCMIHATHMDAAETKRLAASGAVAGLCPITEANLGDGIFNGKSYLAADGTYGIGTDSNVLISLCEELRTLEYSQRLRQRQRNVMATSGTSTGENLYRSVATGGAQALQRNAGVIATGMLADLVAMDTDHPTLIALRDDQLIDGFVFAANQNLVSDVWSAGRHCVKSGTHRNAASVAATYRKTMARLKALL